MTNLHVRAVCILEALGTATLESENAYARAYVGALLFAEVTHEVKQIRRLLTPKE